MASSLRRLVSVMYFLFFHVVFVLVLTRDWVEGGSVQLWGVFEFNDF